MTEFQNLMPFDFTIEENVIKQKEAIEYVRQQLGKEYPNIVGGKEVYTDKKNIILQSG